MSATEATEDALQQSVSNIGQLAAASAFGVELSLVLGGGFSLIAEMVRIESEQRPFSLPLPRRIREICPAPPANLPDGGGAAALS